MTQSSAMEVDRAFDRAMGAIRDAPDVALACHVSPDGDALGSMLGLFHVLRGAGTNCVASFPTPFVVAPHYRELPGLDRLTPPHDVPVSRLSRTLFEEHRFAYLQLLGDALNRAHLVPERRFVWTAVTQGDLAKYQVTIEEVEGLIDILRRTAEAEVTCVLKEEADGTVRVSLRSLGEIDVRSIAEAEGGGGHRFAAGFSSDDDVDAVVRRIEHKLPIAR